jgi:hypothetical protein
MMGTWKAVISRAPRLLLDAFPQAAMLSRWMCTGRGADCGKLLINGAVLGALSRASGHKGLAMVARPGTLLTLLGEGLTAIPRGEACP